MEEVKNNEYIKLLMDDNNYMFDTISIATKNQIWELKIVQKKSTKEVGKDLNISNKAVRYTIGSEIFRLRKAVYEGNVNVEDEIKLKSLYDERIKKINEEIKKELYKLVIEQVINIEAAAEQLSIGCGIAEYIIYQQKKILMKGKDIRKVHQKKEIKLKEKIEQIYNTISEKTKHQVWELAIVQRKRMEEMEKELCFCNKLIIYILLEELQRLKKAIIDGNISMEDEIKYKRIIDQDYKKLNEDSRKKLWELVVVQGLSCKEAGKQLSISCDIVEYIIYQQKKKLTEANEVREVNQQNGDSKPKGRIGQIYNKISNDDKKKLFEVVNNQQMSLKEAAEKFCIKYSTAGTIVFNERKRLREATKVEKVNIKNDKVNESMNTKDNQKFIKLNNKVKEA